MSKSRRQLESFLSDRAKLSTREEKITLELAKATRQLFHNIFILGMDAPDDARDSLPLGIGVREDEWESVSETIDGVRYARMDRIAKSFNPRGRLLDVMEYGRYPMVGVCSFIIGNAGVLAISCAGGSLPEAILKKTLCQSPIGVPDHFTTLTTSPFPDYSEAGVEYAEDSVSPDDRVLVLCPT